METEFKKSDSKILIVDDSESIITLLTTVLSDDFSITSYSNPIEALEHFRGNQKYDCIILDLMMPQMSGMDFLKEIRNFNPEIPIIILTAREKAEEEIAGVFHAGANDYLNKPFLISELKARLTSHIRLRNTNELLKSQNEELRLNIKNEEKLNQLILRRTIELKESFRKIRNLNKKLRFLASYDKLTGCLNRRAFFSFLENDIKRLKRTKTHLSIIMIDLDYFKSINDTYGHMVGDVVLGNVAKVINSSIREIDLIGRYGGEEFLVLLTDCDLKGGTVVAEKIRKVVENYKITIDKEEELRVTISAGVSEYIPGESVDNFLERTDRALYQAKNRGRNQVIIAK